MNAPSAEGARASPFFDSFPTPASEGIPLSLYIHFPWCVRKCPYCDFNSHGLKGHGLRGEIDEDAYVQALIRDLDFELRDAAESRQLTSIFIGGGTPSLFSDRAIGAALDAAARQLHFADGIEITLEANPGTVDAAHFRGYRAAGVNRLSIGVQSLDDSQLKKLGRIHGRADAVKAVEIARAAGFDNLNLDLMYALPEQTPEAALVDLEAALALAPEHFSYYQLTLEPNTEFAARPPPLPDDEAAWDMQLAAQARLAEAGYAQYEVSAYARPGRQCRHNRNYWSFGDYIGIGAGAHGKRTHADGIGTGEAGIVRRARQKHPRLYLQSAGTASALQEERAVTREERPYEFAMNALRLNEGFGIEDFIARTGLPEAGIARVLERLRGRGLLEMRDGRIATTALGRAHLNSVVAEFI